MLRYEVVEETGQQLGNWVDTSLEEKYGHLVPVTETLHAFRESGNLYMIVRNTGNAYLETFFDSDLGMNVTRMVSRVLYRNPAGGLETLNLVFKVAPLPESILTKYIPVFRLLIFTDFVNCWPFPYIFSR